MRKLLTLNLVFAILFFGVNAQQNDLKKEKKDKFSQMQKQEASTKFLKGTSSVYNTKAIECMPEATYSNVPADFETGSTSNTDAGYIVAQKIEGFEYPVGAIRFFGIQGFFDGAWNPVNDVDPFEFEIKFYEDNAGTPGAEISTETVSLSHVNTEVVFADVFHIFHWDYTPSAPITGLTETFWVGIANTSTTAWFMWIDTPTGSGSGAQYDIAAGTWGATDNPYGICIVPVLAEPGSPAAPTDFVVTPGENGALAANITWTNPTTTFDGETLIELTSVSLWVNDEATAEYENTIPDIGGDEAYTFTTDASGLYKFHVYGTNSIGDGAIASQTVWIGEDVPAAPANVLLVASGYDAEITWDAPTTGLHEGYFNPTNTTYSIVRMPDAVELATDLTAEAYTDIGVPSIGNYLYVVTAHNDVGEGGNAASNAALLGALILEGFEEDSPPAGWTNDGWQISEYGYGYGSAHSGTKWAYSNTVGSTLTTPTVTLPVGEAYNFSFYYRVESALNPQGLDVMISIDGGAFQNVAGLTALTNTTYMQHKINLSDYAGSDVQLQFLKAGAATIWGICIDDVSLYKLHDNDLAALSITGNTTPTVDIETVYTISVENCGMLPQENYTIKLMREGGAELGTLPGTSIASGEVKEFSFPWTPQAGDEGTTFIYGVVELTSDEQTTNNQTGNLTLIIQPAGAGVVIITIGTGTTIPNVRIPFDFYWKTSFTQTLYYPSEIGLGGGVLTAIAYTNHFVSDLSAKDVRVWIGETDEADLTDGWVDPTTLTLVYDGTMDFPSGENSIVFPLETPYVYTGGILVIYTNRVWEDSETTPHDKFYCTEDLGSKRTLRIIKDGNAPLDPNNPGFGSISDWHPNTALFFSTEGIGSLDGTVTHGTVPLEGVEVSVVGTSAKTTTDATGEYTFLALLADTYSVKFEKLGYITHTEEDVVIVADATETVDVTLNPIPSFTVTGIAKGNDGVLLEGATVTLTGYSTHNATANIDGVFSIENVYEGTYELAIALEGYEGYFNPAVAVNSEVATGGVVNLGTLTLTEIIVMPYALTVELDPEKLDQALLSWNGSFDGSILLVDHDVSNVITNFTDAGAVIAATLDGLDLNYTLVESDASYNGPSYDVMKDYDAVIWVTGEGWNNGQTMTPSDEANLKHYLNNGGIFIFSGMDYIYDFYGQNTNTFTKDQFAYDYFGLRTVAQDAWWMTHTSAQSAQGSVGSFAEGLTLDLVDVYKTKEGLTTDNITGHVGMPIIDITETPSGVAAIKYKNTIFSSASLEAIADDNARADFIMEALNSFMGKNQKTFNGFNVLLDGEPVAEEIEGTSYLLTNLNYETTYTAGVQSAYTSGNSETAEIIFTTPANPNTTPVSQLTTVDAYPNPFDKQIKILNAELVERMVITNILGQRVMDITLNGSKEIATGELGSGIYLITLEGLNGEKIVRKMIKR